MRGIIILDRLEDVLDGARNDAPSLAFQCSLHCVGLASASLPIGNDGSVIALQPDSATVTVRACQTLQISSASIEHACWLKLHAAGADNSVWFFHKLSLLDSLLLCKR